MKGLSYTIRIEPDEEEGYVVSVPALSGCYTQGETFEEALAMAKEAIECYLESLVEDGLPVPADEPPREPVTSRVEVKTPLAVCANCRPSVVARSGDRATTDGPLLRGILRDANLSEERLRDLLECECNH